MYLYRHCVSAILLNAAAFGTYAADTASGTPPDTNPLEPDGWTAVAVAPDPNDAGALMAPLDPKNAGAAVALPDPNAPLQMATTGTQHSPADVLDPNAPQQAVAAEDVVAAPAEVSPPPRKAETAPGAVMDMAAVIALVQQQQAQLEKQQDMLDKQSRQLAVLSEELDALRAPPVTEEAREQILSLIHISEPTRHDSGSRMPSSA